MAYLIGVDEAGYGPNLGPLVVSATTWRVPDAALRCDLYETLAECVTREPARFAHGRLTIADSKKLYSPGTGLGPLELGVLAALRAQGTRITNWRELWDALDPSFASQASTLFAHEAYEATLPVAADPSHVTDAAETFAVGLRRADVSLRSIRAVAVFPERWNDLCDEHQSKGAALSHCTLALVRELLESLDEAPTLVVCDKHGGRNRYGPLLQHFFPDQFVEAHDETRAASRYRWGPPARRVEIAFVAKGESFLPSALASMTAKYLREMAMAAFNQFWLRRLPGLRPTAGYPVDARRFWSEIEAVRRQLGIPDRHVWRNR